jgi:type II secretory pathway pseudopilin PulG
MPHPSRRRKAFSLVELLVAIGIIVLLIGILVPVVGRVRQSARAADTRNWISQLSSAIERYHGDFRAYPGPLRYDQLDDTSVVLPVASTGSGFATAPWGTVITGTENLVLGLLGGLRLNTAGAIVYDPAAVGNGPGSLNAAQPRTYSPYVDVRNLSWRDAGAGQTGQFADASGTARDTLIPEFVDTFPEPMPILYLRSRVGQPAITTGISGSNNSVITDGTGTRPGAYDISQINAYTDSTIGEGKTLRHSQYVNPALAAGNPLTHGLRTVDPTKSMNRADGTAFTYPFDAHPYFRHPTIPNTPREKDRYILISAGPDRVYGTDDDITSFGDLR